jgi:hypothetical protein
MNQFERNPPESNAEEPRQAGPARVFAGPLHCGSIDGLRRKSCDVVARANIPRVRTETKQSPVGPAPQNLLDDRLQSRFVAKVAGAEVSVEANSRGFHGFLVPIDGVKPEALADQRSSSSDDC